MLTLDSSYIANREEYIKDGNDAMDSLMRLFENDEMTMNQLRLLKNTVTNRINTQNSNIQRVVTGDTSGLTDALNRGDKLMTAFRSDALRIEKEALRDSAVAKTRKNLFESILPNSFSIIMIFSGVITLLSFFLIIREMRIRQKYQEELERKLICPDFYVPLSYDRRKFRFHLFQNFIKIDLTNIFLLINKGGKVGYILD